MYKTYWLIIMFSLASSMQNQHKIICGTWYRKKLGRILSTNFFFHSEYNNIVSIVKFSFLRYPCSYVLQSCRFIQQHKIIVLCYSS